MLDIFTKSRIEPSPRSVPFPFQSSPSMDGAWRIARAINDALKAAEAEKAIFSSRVEDAVAWAAVSLGNGNDEYLEREALDTLHLNRFDAEIRDRTEYLARLEQNIDQFSRLKAMLVGAFPEIARISAI